MQIRLISKPENRMGRFFCLEIQPVLCDPDLLKYIKLNRC